MKTTISCKTCRFFTIFIIILILFLVEICITSRVVTKKKNQAPILIIFPSYPKPLKNGFVHHQSRQLLLHVIKAGEQLKLLMKLQSNH